MKSFQTQTHYEVLEISVGATASDVQSAYERLSNLYSDEQVVLYGLIDAGLADALRSRLKEAHDVLSDDSRRDAYDVKIGLPPRGLPSKPKPVTAPRPSAAPAPTWSSNYTFVAAPPAAPPPPSQGFTWVVATPSRAVPTAPMQPPAVLAPPPAEVRPPPEPAPAPPPSAPVEAPAPVLVEAPSIHTPEPGDVAPETPAAVDAPAPRLGLRLLSEPTPVVESVDNAPTSAPVAEESAIVPVRPSITREFKAQAPPRPYEIPEGVEINGDLLRQVRLARGLTMAQLADRTRIGPKHLENIEGDRYDALPATVYLRGMLMSLARELGLDGLRVSKSYQTFVEAHRSKG